MENNFNDQGYVPDNDQNFTEDYGSVVSGVDKAPKKRKGVLIGGICAGVVCVAVGGSAIAYAASDYVKNQVKLFTLDDQEYYSWVMEKNGSDAADELSEAYDDYLEKLEDGYGNKLSISLEPTDEAMELLLSEMFGSDYKRSSDSDMNQLIDVIENIDSIELGVEASRNNKASNASIYASLNNDKIVSAEVGMDDKSALYMRIPEYNKQWLSYDMSTEFTGQEEEIFNKFMDLSNDPSSFITPDELSDMIEKYTGILGDSLKDVKRYKDQKVEIGGAEVEYTVLKAEITPQDVLNIAEGYVSSALKDKTIKNILVNELDVCSDNEYESVLEDALDEIRAAADEIDENEENLDAALFVDARGDIRGFQFYLEDECEIKFAVGQSGDDIVGEFTVNDGDEDIVSIQLNAKEDGGKYSGTIEMFIDDEPSTAEITFADFEIVDEDKGYVNGKLSISVPEVPSVDLVLKSDGKSQTISYDLKIERGNFGTVSLNIAETDGSDISFKGSVNLDSDFDVEEYFNEDALAEFIESICQKIGLDDDFAEQLTEAIIYEIVGGSYDNDYDNFDDFDYDDDDDIYGEWEDWDDLDDYEDFDDIDDLF